ncbi:MAG: sulfite exporter TauE/SafE family protein [Planctomycetota bacterium]
MPELFPNLTTFVLCGLIVAGAQLIYAMVGFGAGMFAIALLALVLPDLAPAVATLLILTFVTEVWVLAGHWRKAKLWLLVGLLPTMIIGMWLGTALLTGGDEAWLKRMLGLVVLAAGLWFLVGDRQRNDRPDTADAPDFDNSKQPWHRGTKWLSIPAGLISGLLGGLFGTGGPPIIIFLRAYRLDKGAFRSTILWFFLLMSFVRAESYLHSGLLTWSEIVAAGWLLPPSLAGMLLGMAAHRRLSEKHFGIVVAVLLVFLGVLLMVGLGK